MQSAARSYFQTQVSTTTQGDLVIMLFDAALKFLHHAKEKIAERDFAQKGILISKAMDILSELQGSLNAQKGGDLADRLQKLYFYCNARLLKANLKMDVTLIEEVERILNGLRDAFAQANAQVTTKPVPASVTQGTAHTQAPPQAPAAPITLPRAQAYQNAANPARPAATAYTSHSQAAAPQASPTQAAKSASQEGVPVSEQTAPAKPTILPGPGGPAKPTPLNRIMAAYAATRAAS